MCFYVPVDFTSSAERKRRSKLRSVTSVQDLAFISGIHNKIKILRNSNDLDPGQRRTQGFARRTSRTYLQKWLLQWHQHIKSWKLTNTYSYSTTNKMHLLSQIIYSCKTLYMFRTVFPSIIRSSKLRIQQREMSNSCCYLLLSGMRWNCRAVPSHPHLMLYTQFWAPGDGRKDRPKHVERCTRINDLR